MKLEALHAHAERLIRRATGVPELLTDDDGNWLGFPFGRSLVFVRALDHEEPYLLVYGVAANEVEPSAELYEFLNETNSRLRYCRAYLLKGTIYVEIELLGESLDYEEFDNAMTRVGRAASYFGVQAVERFGGATPLDDGDSSAESVSVPPTAAGSHGTGGYL